MLCPAAVAGKAIASQAATKGESNRLGAHCGVWFAKPHQLLKRRDMRTLVVPTVIGRRTEGRDDVCEDVQ